MERRRCANCWHNRDGDCKLSSSRCATQVLNREGSPVHWMSIGEGLEEAIRIIIKEVS